MADENQNIEASMDSQALYREEVFTDRRVGTIQRLTPVDGDGNPDTSRQVLYVGQTQLMTRAGPLPLSFELAGSTLAEAADSFSDAAQVAVEEAVSRLEDMRREAASSIIVPEAGGPGGGNKIQMP